MGGGGRVGDRRYVHCATNVRLFRSFHNTSGFDMYSTVSKLGCLLSLVVPMILLCDNGEILQLVPLPTMAVKQTINRAYVPCLSIHLMNLNMITVAKQSGMANVSGSTMTQSY